MSVTVDERNGSSERFAPLGRTPEGAPLPPLRDRFRSRIADSPRLLGWLGPIAVTLLAFAARVWRLEYPPRLLFDETYYAKDAWSLLRFGYAQDWVEDANAKVEAGQTTGLWTGEPTQVVHPEVGKWMIAIGEQLFGMNAFGWRISAAVVGALTVLVLARMVRRLSGSTALGCLAGLLLAVDGVHLVMSRLALLDVFLAFWLVCAVACVVADREWGRTRIARRYATTETVSGFGPVRMLLLRPWRLAAGVCFGLAVGTKWSALYVLAAVGVFVWVLDVIDRRAIGVRGAWWRSMIVDGLPAFVSLVIVALVVYVVTWTGFLVNHEVFEGRFGLGYGDAQPWGSAIDKTDRGLIGELLRPLESLWHYHQMVYSFHTGDYLAGKSHPYQSDPWGWLVLNRPVGVDAQTDLAASTPGCAASGTETCIRQVLILGNPAVWWGGLAALVASVWYWLRDRDWRFGLLVLVVVSAWLPWFAYDDRPIFLFYATAFVPFTCAAIALVAGRLLRGSRGSRLRWWAPAALGTYVAVALALAAFFFPIWTDILITHEEWLQRMWFSRWV
ncbi:phospholipid carrier-dependent glycosyltransferase [Mumia sp. zg.B17]|uniref:dolichyl-phosphate-mannose--protein mannosyltransferase n=1 Tax=Mumia sp. zg.B17 TaxID=2855446 RepID=UPI001C6DDCE9|nr:phospholipid carrier-dependent glycosyltransferase [Mumia sp. zg.B17]MBW9206941.1 phospholipid carrier-dependent glycosyltransferase [Mumia sp. zg.B17]